MDIALHVFPVTAAALLLLSGPLMLTWTITGGFSRQPIPVSVNDELSGVALSRLI